MAERQCDACLDSILKMVNISYVSDPMWDFMGNVSAFLLSR